MKFPDTILAGLLLLILAIVSMTVFVQSAPRAPLPEWVRVEVPPEAPAGLQCWVLKDDRGTGGHFPVCFFPQTNR